jgi:ribosomal subunit interface protein
MQINIKVTNAKLTPESHEVINDKINGLSKYFGNIIKADVEIGINSMHHNKGNIYKAIVNLSVPGKVLRASAETDNIEKSISQVKNKLKIELVKYKDTHR